MAIPSRTTTTNADGGRIWVYPRDIPGLFHHMHRWTSAALHFFLFVVPWLKIHGERVLFIDLPGRKVWAMGTLYTAADGVLLMILGLIAAFSLFFFTALFGRLWCGYACPQSVFLINWVLPIEQYIEGDWRARKKRDDRGFTWTTTARKGVKFAAFAVIATALSMAFMGFFTDPWELWTLQAGGANYAIVGVFAAGWFVDFTYFREQVCNYVCPYARFQGALMDEESLTIGYDALRGETRGGKGAAAAGRCLDCNWCVQVCPQGIDIRDGFQLECIACGRCVDACTSVMLKASPRTRTLVSYSTVAESKGDSHGSSRFRTRLYGVLLIGLSLTFAVLVLTRAPFEISVNRAPGSLFQVDGGDEVRNTYLVRHTNTAGQARDFTFAVEGLPEATVVIPPVNLEPEESRQIPLALSMPLSLVDSRTYPITVSASDGTVERTWETTFKTPGPAVASESK